MTGVEIELRFQNATTTGKLRKLPSEGYVVPNPFTSSWVHEEPCWNKASPCVVNRVTLRAYLTVFGQRVNVTRLTRMCDGNECILPALNLTVKPGERLRLHYDSVTATWKEPPRVVAAAIVASPASVSFTYTKGGPLPAPQTVTVIAPGWWATTDSSPFYDASGACWSGGGGSCASGAKTMLTPSQGMAGLAVGSHRADLTITSGSASLVVPVTVTVK